jgi:phospholipid/cholesterol/gamma-HCH transport system substrate-binding protein
MTETGTPAMRATLPVARDTRRLAAAVKPVGANAAKLLQSFQKTGGINRFMDYVFFQVAAINGFDSFGHYLRAGLIVNQCANYAIQPTFGCSANFPRAANATSTTAAPRDEAVVRSARALARALGLPVPDAPPEEKKQQERQPKERTVADQQVAPEPTPAPEPAQPAEPTQQQTETLLDYLFGGDE